MKALYAIRYAHWVLMIGCYLGRFSHRVNLSEQVFTREEARMRFTEENQLYKQLQETGAAGLYLLYGEEEYLVSRWRDKIIEPFAKEGSFNLQKFDGRQPNFYEIYDATQQLPLFAAQKCVLVDDLDPKKLLAEELKLLTQIIEELPEETVLVFTFLGNSLQPTSATPKKLVKLAEDRGTVVVLSYRDIEGITRFLQSEAKAWGCTISAPLCKELVRLCGKEMQVLTGEIQKIAAYAGGGEITKEHLEAVVVPTIEERVFDLGKAILAGNSQKALEVLSNLYFLKESPIAIISTLIMSYVDLYRARIARDAGKTQQEVVQGFGYKGREFRVKNAYQSKISLGAVQQALEILKTCDFGMKSTPQSQEQQLEKAVVELLVVRGREG